MISKQELLSKLGWAARIEGLVNQWHKQRPIDQMDTERDLRHARAELKSAIRAIEEMEWPKDRPVYRPALPPDSCTCFQGHAPCSWCTREIDETEDGQ